MFSFNLIEFVGYRMLKTEHCKDAKMWKKIALMQLEGINFEAIDMTGLKSRDLFKQRVWLE